MEEEITTQMKMFLKDFAAQPYLAKNYYFTGGTALSYYYFHHRISVDLDFFSFQKINPQESLSFVSNWAMGQNAILNAREVGDVQIYELRFSSGENLKVDFAYYPYKQVEKPTMFNGILVDSKKDIGVNKIITVSQRTDVKDFVDLYFLLKEFSVYELYELSNLKFRRDYDLMLFASDLVKVKRFEYLPKMIINLTLEELTRFYLNLSLNIGGHATKP